MHATQVRAAIGAAALMLVLTGCSNTGDTSTKAEDTPLGAYMASVWGSDLSEDEMQERSERDNREREELIAACMKDQGFEYEPNVDNGGTYYSSGDEWKPDDREWGAQYGYGMVNWPGRDEMQNQAPDEEYVDPNQDYIDSLSESEQAAFWEALHGPQPSEEEMSEDGSYEYNWETAGCYGSAQHEMEADDPLTSEKHKPVMDAINEFYMAMDTDPRFAEIDDAWASCMADAGYPGYAKQADAQQGFSEELNAYYENQTEWVEDDPELAKLGEEEIDLALVDLDCREKTDYREKRQAIATELESEFIKDHKAELDALKADAEQSR